MITKHRYKINSNGFSLFKSSSSTVFFNLHNNSIKKLKTNYSNSRHFSSQSEKKFTGPIFKRDRSLFFENPILLSNGLSHYGSRPFNIIPYACMYISHGNKLMDIISELNEKKAFSPAFLFSLKIYAQSEYGRVYFVCESLVNHPNLISLVEHSSISKHFNLEDLRDIYIFVEGAVEI